MGFLSAVPFFFLTKLDVGNSSFLLLLLLLRKALRHVTSFKAHSCLITMALDHFRTFCCPHWAECLAHALPGAELQHPPPAPQQPLASPCSRPPQSNRMNGAAWGMWTQKEECHFAECNPIQPTPLYTHTHTHSRACTHGQTCTQEHPYKSRHVSNAGGKKCYNYDFFFWWTNFSTWQYPSIYEIINLTFEYVFMRLCWLMFMRVNDFFFTLSLFHVCTITSASAIPTVHCHVTCMTCDK